MARDSVDKKKCHSWGSVGKDWQPWIQGQQSADPKLHGRPGIQKSSLQASCTQAYSQGCNQIESKHIPWVPFRARPV